MTSVDYIASSDPNAGAVPSGTGVATHARTGDSKEIQDVYINGGENMPPITGEVTANAGTNLNTSLLAREDEGNLASIAASNYAISTAVNGTEMQTDVVTLPPNVVDANNSTTTPLGSNATFTGTGTDLLNYAGLTVTLFADQASASNGMRFEFSTDNTNWDVNVASGFDYLASTGRIFQFTVQARYFRIRFTNGTSAQGAFRVQTLLHRDAISLTSIHRLDADVKPDRSATLTKAALLAQVNGSGDFVTIQANTAGILKIGGSVEVTTLPAVTATNLDIRDLTATDVVTNTPQTLGTATLSNVSANAASVQLLASTAGRKQSMFYNDADKFALLKFGTTASATSFTVKILAGGYYELPMPVYTGRIDAIWDTGPTGAMRITELT
jgi:hypothetical protein